MTWDLEDPPAEPPPDADPLVWRLSYGLYQDHRVHTDGFCVTCKQYWPCPNRRIAERGLAVAHAARWQLWPVTAGLY